LSMLNHVKARRVLKKLFPAGQMIKKLGDR